MLLRAALLQSSWIPECLCGHARGFTEPAGLLAGIPVACVGRSEHERLFFPGRERGWRVFPRQLSGVVWPSLFLSLPL